MLAGCFIRSSISFGPLDLDKKLSIPGCLDSGAFLLLRNKDKLSPVPLWIDMNKDELDKLRTRTLARSHVESTHDYKDLEDFKRKYGG